MSWQHLSFVYMQRNTNDTMRRRFHSIPYISFVFMQRKKFQTFRGVQPVTSTALLKYGREDGYFKHML